MNYLIILTTCLIFFYRTIYLGCAVDDNVLQKTLRHREEKIKNKEIRFWCLDELAFRLYGAGLCKNLQLNHFLVTLLHAVNCCLIYMATDSLLASMLYMLNPAMNQTAIWMNGRRYAVGIFCVLLSWNFPQLFLPLYAFSSWLHVYTIAFPVLMFFTDFWYLPIVGVVLALIFARKPIMAKFRSRKKDYAQGNELQKLKPQKIILYIKSLGFYFWHTLIPVKPRMYHEFLYYFSRYEEETKRGYSLNFDFFKGLVAASFVGYELIVHQNIWALWWLVFISQYCNVITVTQNVADRYCSLSGIGLMVILSQYLSLLPSPYMETVTAVILTYYVMRYLPLFRAYKSILDFHEYHMWIDPSGVESRTLLSHIFLQLKDPHRAFAVLKTGLKYRPKDFKLLLMMSQTMFFLGKVEEGLQVLDIAEKNVPIGDEEPCKKEFAEMRKHYLNEMNRLGMHPTIVNPSNPSQQIKLTNRKARRAFARKQKKLDKKQ